jgi:hypothetical protein
MMAKQMHFKEAVLLALETAAAKAGGESQAMLFAILLEQHNKQVPAIAATNKATMGMMMEKMNALVAGGGGRQTTHQDKKIPPPPGGGVLSPPTGTGTNPAKKTKRHKCLCPNYKMFVLHKPENCYKLRANKDKHWPGWNSVHTTA